MFAYNSFPFWKISMEFAITMVVGKLRDNKFESIKVQLELDTC